MGETLIRRATGRANKTSAVWVLLVIAGLSGTSALRLDPEQAIENGFANVIRDSGTTPGAAIAVAGSEEYWLKQSIASKPAGTADLERVVWNGPVAAGGKLIIGQGSSSKELEVLAVEQGAPGSVTRIDMGNQTTSGSIRVQARDDHDLSAPAMWLELTPLGTLAPETALPTPIASTAPAAQAL